jgi:HD-GYP domain-containing protein (c-di-GMP phosphodiesterase class II)
VKLARAMHVGPADLTHIRRGALLHDIGKLGIADAILHKPGPLSEEERDVMRHHPTYAYEWLAPILALRPALDIPYCHHERWDGTGYPRGLKGEQIPPAARIFAVVDIWDALRSDRPYRGACPEEEVRHRIHALAGTHLDSGVVEAFLGTMPGDDMIGLAPGTAMMRAISDQGRGRKRSYHAGQDGVRKPVICQAGNSDWL